MVADPFGECRFRSGSSGDVEDGQDDGFVIRVQPETVQRQEQFGDDERRPLVAVDERVVAGEAVAVCGRDLRQVRRIAVSLQVLRASERRL